MGSLISFKNNKSSHNPLINIGTQDITSFVDFEHLSTIARQEGFEIEYFATQEVFLLEHGILEMKFGYKACDVRMLTSPDEMGEIVKVLLCSK
jgi:SAM-dependent MidA family methyltransferase